LKATTLQEHSTMLLELWRFCGKTAVPTWSLELFSPTPWRSAR
jgi:hypothetical protein